MIAAFSVLGFKLLLQVASKFYRKFYLKKGICKVNYIKNILKLSIFRVGNNAFWTRIRFP